MDTKFYFMGTTRDYIAIVGKHPENTPYIGVEVEGTWYCLPARHDLRFLKALAKAMGYTLVARASRRKP